MSSKTSLQPGAGPLVTTPNDAMQTLRIARAKLYELLNSGELESYTEGKSRRILVSSIHAYVERRLAVETAKRGRGRAASHTNA